jgi:Holliday junction DNA helicase RuvA
VITSLRGRLVRKDGAGAVVECGGVGYGVAMSLSSLSRLGKVGGDVFVLVHTHLTQDALRLYGFADEEEQQAFEVLIGTTGVGPKLALAILSSLSPAELAGIVSRADKVALTRVPGVGGKKAERLLVELKGRLPQVGFGAPAGRPSLVNDVVSALSNLGFSDEVADQAARAALEKHPGETEIATLVRAALQETRA